MGNALKSPDDATIRRGWEFFRPTHRPPTNRNTSSAPFPPATPFSPPSGLPNDCSRGRQRKQTPSSTLSYLALYLLSTHSTFAQNPLNIPPELTGPTFNLSMDIGTTQFTAGVNTTTYGYNGSYLGPTLIMNSGDAVTLNVTNNLGETTTTHWHGMHVASGNDGGPHSSFEDGETWSPQFTVLDTASTMWYHPHLHSKTMEQVNYGLAGMLLVRDSVETAAGLPVSYGVDEFPIVLQDREFAPNGNFIIAPRGSTMLINGTVDPYLEVPAQMVRFRLLNGSNERAYNVGVSDGRNFYLIGADGGLLEAPAQINRVLLMPGERADIVFDFSADQGDTLHLMSYASEMATSIPGATVGGPGGALNGVDFNLLELNVVAATADPVTSLPASIWTLDKHQEIEATVTRTIQMTGAFTLDHQAFSHDRIDQTVFLDAVEIWELQNTTGAAHPFHIHDIQFFLLDRNGSAANLEAWEMGKKDTILVEGNQTVRFIAKFDHFADPEIPYMYHCHILPHEDAGMMAQFIVVDPEDSLLDITSDGSNISLSWFANLDDAFTLQSSFDLESFTDVTEIPAETNGVNLLTLPRDTEERFFRLYYP